MFPKTFPKNFHDFQRESPECRDFLPPKRKNPQCRFRGADFRTEHKTCGRPTDLGASDPPAAIAKATCSPSAGYAFGSLDGNCHGYRDIGDRIQQYRDMSGNGGCRTECASTRTSELLEGRRGKRRKMHVTRAGELQLSGPGERCQRNIR